MWARKGPGALLRNNNAQFALTATIKQKSPNIFKCLGLNGDPEGTRTLDLLRDRQAF